MARLMVKAFSIRGRWWRLEDAAYGRDLRRALRSMVKTTGLIGRRNWHRQKPSTGERATGFSLPPPRGSLVARCLGAVEDRLSERSASCRPNSDFAAPCRPQ